MAGVCSRESMAHCKSDIVPYMSFSSQRFIGGGSCRQRMAGSLTSVIKRLRCLSCSPARGGPLLVVDPDLGDSLLKSWRFTVSQWCLSAYFHWQILFPGHQQILHPPLDATLFQAFGIHGTRKKLDLSLSLRKLSPRGYRYFDRCRSDPI